jgi:hypothetical protein
MFFGLTNSPTTFQQVMNKILKELVTTGNILVYLDDIIIFTEDLNHHWQVLRTVLQKLHEHRLLLKLEKCQFKTLEMEYLGVMVMDRSVWMQSRCRESLTGPPLPWRRMFRVFWDFVIFTGASCKGSLGSPSHSLN